MMRISEKTKLSEVELALITHRLIAAEENGGSGEIHVIRMLRDHIHALDAEITELEHQLFRCDNWDER